MQDMLIMNINIIFVPQIWKEYM